MNEAQQIPDYVPPGEPARWYHNGWFSRSFLIVAGLFFLLPFITIKCGSTKIADVRGVDLITGHELKAEQEKEDKVAEDSLSVEDDITLNGQNFTEQLFEKGDQKKIAPNVLGIIGFSSLILALTFTFFSRRLPVIISGGLALLGALSLFFIQMQVHSEVETKLGPFNFAAFTIEFTPYYWCCLLFMTLAGIFGFVRSSALK